MGGLEIALAILVTGIASIVSNEMITRIPAYLEFDERPVFRLPPPALGSAAHVFGLGAVLTLSTCESDVRRAAVEIGMAIATGVALWLFGATLEGAAFALAIWTAIALVAMDYETQFLPYAITWPLAGLGLAFAAFAPSGAGIVPSLVGAVLAFAMIEGVNLWMRFRRGVVGLGGGDTWFLVAIGAWHGPLAVCEAIFFGALISLALIPFGVHRDAGEVYGEEVAGQTGVPLGVGLGVMFVALFFVSPFISFVEIVGL